MSGVENDQIVTRDVLCDSSLNGHICGALECMADAPLLLESWEFDTKMVT